MGLNFSYILYFSRERWWEALEGVAQRVDSGVVNSVLFPEGERQIALPSWGIRSKIPFTHETPVLRFATSLSFKEDLFILEYLKDLDPSSVHRSPPDDDGVNWYKIGLIYIDVYNDVSEYSRSLNDPNLVVMTFTAASTNMSLLFLESSSVREGFTDLLRQHDGIAGLLDMEGEARVFWWKGRVLDSLVAGSSYWPLEKIEEDLE